jgi:hypothetical protein
MRVTWTVTWGRIWLTCLLTACLCFRDEGDTDSDVGSDMADMSGSDMDDDDGPGFGMGGGGQYGDRLFMDEETKSRFTEYSMTSSVMRRSDGLTLLDDRFEKVCETIFTSLMFVHTGFAPIGQVYEFQHSK